MGLDNFWQRVKSGSEETTEYENVSYDGDDLPSEFLNEGLKSHGYFRGKVFADLFSALVGDISLTLYCDENMSTEDIVYCYERMAYAKDKLLADDGELWLESFKNEEYDLRESEYKDIYSYEEVLSFILMWEWYSQVEDIQLYGWY